MTDKTKLTFGKYAGTRLEKVPASYLLWLYDNDKCPADLRAYIVDNMYVLQSEYIRLNPDL